MSSPPGMIVNAQGMTAEGIEFSLINETGQAITVTPILVPVPPTPELDTEFVGGSLSVPPTSLPYNSKDVDPNLVQFSYPAPPGVYNAFVQVDGWTYEVGADLVVEGYRRQNRKSVLCPTLGPSHPFGSSRRRSAVGR